MTRGPRLSSGGRAQLSGADVFVPLEFSRPAWLKPAGHAAVQELGGATMGTTWSVKIVASRQGSLSHVQHRIEAELATIIAQMSTWDAASDISRFNRAPAGSWHALPREFAHVLAHGLRIARSTNGAYDPAVGALVELWGFGPGRGAPSCWPAENEISAARGRRAYERLDLDQATARAYQPGGVSLDLSAIAKGYAVDAVSEALAALGFRHHLVEIGGELRGSGVKPDGLPWWVEIERPGEFDGVVGGHRIALSGWAIATSGDYRRAFVLNGRRFSHTIDPRDGKPVAHDLASASVLHKSCMVADALATALMVMGPEQGLAFAEEHAIPALFLARARSAGTAIASSALRAMQG